MHWPQAGVDTLPGDAGFALGAALVAWRSRGVEREAEHPQANAEKPQGHQVQLRSLDPIASQPPPGAYEPWSQDRRSAANSLKAGWSRRQAWTTSRPGRSGRSRLTSNTSAGSSSKQRIISVAVEQAKTSRRGGAWHVQPRRSTRRSGLPSQPPGNAYRGRCRRLNCASEPAAPRTSPNHWPGGDFAFLVRALTWIGSSPCGRRAAALRWAALLVGKVATAESMATDEASSHLLTLAVRDRFGPCVSGPVRPCSRCARPCTGSYQQCSHPP